MFLELPADRYGDKHFFFQKFELSVVCNDSCFQVCFLIFIQLLLDDDI